MDAYAAVINLKTGTRTPYRVVWTVASDANEPDTCRYCTAATPADVDDDDWACDECTERLALADWFNRSHEAQDRAVLRGMG